MTAELVRFGLVLFVVVLGFAVSFSALLIDRHGNILLRLFEAMLGDVGLFDDLVGDRYEHEASVLLVVYLVIVTIMLLNLLIAVLSTSHSKVEANAHKEFHISKALLIQHYQTAVRNDELPAPFNLVQLAVSLPFKLADALWQGEAYHQAKAAVGCTVFWLVVGPVAVVGGTLLWVASALYAPLAWHAYYYSVTENRHRMSPGSMAMRYLIIVVWCILGAPVCLIVMWVRVPFAQLQRFACDRHGSSRPDPTGTYQERSINRSAGDLLKAAYGGASAGEPCEYLDDPIRGLEVRQDEISRGASVEDVKLLRDRLEETTEHLLDSANGKLHTVVTSMNLRLDQLEEMERKRAGQVLEERQKINAMMVMQQNINDNLDLIYSSLARGEAVKAE